MKRFEKARPDSYSALCLISAIIVIAGVSAYSSWFFFENCRRTGSGSSLTSAIHIALIGIAGCAYLINDLRKELRNVGNDGQTASITSETMLPVGYALSKPHEFSFFNGGMYLRFSRAELDKMQLRARGGSFILEKRLPAAFGKLLLAVSPQNMKENYEGADR